MSLDQARKSRSVGAWPSQRGGGAGVLALPPSPAAIVRAPARNQPAPQQSRQVGQDMIPPCPMPPGCCVFPGEMKFISAEIELATGASGTISLDSPGMFCPQKMFVFASVDLADVVIDSIKAGIRNQIISGEIDARAFGIANVCCPIACIDCLCMPGVDLDVGVTNNDALTQTITVVLIGCYVDACPPGGVATHAPTAPMVPGCPTPGGDKLVGFTSGALAASASVDIEIETPGRFCPRQMLLFVSAGGDADDFVITSIKSGLDDQIISGNMPGSLWGIDNECCILSCFKCLCAPGVPLTISITNGDTAQTITGFLVGCYVDAC
jgi:hypothetical protein